MKLTVAIPTYNRNLILADNLRLLLPQLTDECQLRIFDNCSETPVSETLHSLLDTFPSVNCEIIRNSVNIGGNANILRCLESCETEWVWVLGDDDTATPDAVETIFRNIQCYSEALSFSYSTAAYPISATTSWQGLTGFVDGMASFSNVLFLSTSIYRIGRLKSGIRVGYQFAYSGAPHLAVLIQGLNDQSQTCFCAEEIVIQNAPDDASDRWSLIAHAAAIGILFDLPLPASVRTSLAVRVLETFPTSEQIIMQLVLLVVKEKDIRSALFYYEQIGARLYRFDRSTVRRSKWALYRMLLRFPRLGYWIVSLAYRKTRKKDVSLSLLHDRFARM